MRHDFGPADLGLRRHNHPIGSHEQQRASGEGRELGDLPTVLAGRLHHAHRSQHGQSERLPEAHRIGKGRLDLRQQDYEYEEDESLGGRHYDQSLNRRLESAEFSYRQQLTALTTWVARVTREQERFEFESLRNSDTFRATTGFELGRFALIRGTALIGYRKLSTAAGGTFPEFSGLTSNVNVTYSAPTQTRLNAIFNRDIQYSYEDRTPYYVLTQWSGTLTHRVVGGWDVQVTGGRDRLDYQSLAAIFERTDSISRYGGGIGYTIGESLRVGFDVQSFYRSSPIRSREYQNMRAGLSVTYGN